MFNIIEFLSNILGQPEHELVEFKFADQNYDTGKIYQYVSALANEAKFDAKYESPHIFYYYLRTKNGEMGSI